MKGALLIFLLALFSGPVRAAGDDPAVQWKDQNYAAEFCLIEEEGRYDAGSWEALPPETMAQELEAAGAGDRAGERFAQVRSYYDEMIAKWTLEDVTQKYGQLSGGGIRSVRIWLGRDHAAYLEQKRAALGPVRNASLSAPLTEAAVNNAAHYLDPAAAAQLKAVPAAAADPVQAAAKQKKRQQELSGKVDGIKGSYGATSDAGGGKKFFDGAGQSGGSPDEPSVKLSRTPGAVAGTAGADAGGAAGNYRQSHASTIQGGAVPGMSGAVPQGQKAAGFTASDLSRIDSVVADMKQKRQSAGSENGWWGNFKQSAGLSKADSGCSGWSDATITAIKNDPVLSEKYEAGYVRGLRNPVAAVTKWPPSAPLPLPHFVAVVWPKGTDPNDTAIYVDSWANQTKRGPIKEYTYEYSFDPKDLTPTVYYDRVVKTEVKQPGGKTKILTEKVETPIPLIKANPWIFVGK